MFPKSLFKKKWFLKKACSPKLVSKKDFFPQKLVSNLFFLEKFVPQKLVSEKKSFPKSLFLTKTFSPQSLFLKKNLFPRTLFVPCLMFVSKQKAYSHQKLVSNKASPPKACSPKS